MPARFGEVMANPGKPSRSRSARLIQERRDRAGWWIVLGGSAFLVLSVSVLIYCLLARGSEGPEPGGRLAASESMARPQSGPALSTHPALSGNANASTALATDSSAKPGTAAEPKSGTPSVQPSAAASLAKGSVAPEAVATAKFGIPRQDRAFAKGWAFLYPDQAVERAIDRGVAYLKKADDFRTGGKALAGLTLLSCGVPANDLAVMRAAAAVRADAAKLSNTYELSLCLLFLDRLGEKDDEDLIRHVALQLIAGQGLQGGWSYHCFPLRPAQEKKLLSLLQAPVRRAPPGQVFTFRSTAKWKTPVMKLGMVIPADLRLLPAVQYRPGQLLSFQMLPGREDNSLTQFATLALWTAQRHGIPVARTLSFVEARFGSSQSPDGSWGYRWRPGVLVQKFHADSMTCAGLLGLAAGQGVQAGMEAAPAVPAVPKHPAAKAPTPLDVTPAMEAALLFLSQRIGALPLPPQAAAEQIKANARIVQLQMQLRQVPPPQRLAILQQLKQLIAAGHDVTARGIIVGAQARGDLYYLWSLERVGVIYDLRTIGGKDWYAWGAPLIVAAQQADGSWHDLYPGVPDTCFALLFLKRINVARDLTMSLQRLRLSPQAGERMSLHAYSGSPGERLNIAVPKGPPLRSR